ncbi:MAG: hypothetical protein JXA24_07345 [Proteobacteria bacterium]|nr:hypothetical protein [Pseudomonadota bacterium]
MSLNSKYTWHYFLKEHPEHREKGLKRTSSEGRKAFESAFKAHAKQHLDRIEKRYDREIERSKKARAEVMGKVKAFAKAKKFVKARTAQLKAGRADAAIAQIERQKKRAQAARKSL